MKGKAAKADDLDARMARLEDEMKSLKKSVARSNSKAVDAANKELMAASRTVLEEKSVGSAKAFLDRLEKTSSKTASAQLATWTVTVTVVTFLSDDHGD